MEFRPIFFLFFFFYHGVVFRFKTTRGMLPVRAANGSPHPLETSRF